MLDVLSGGRLRLGIGIGWNFVEYEALGENFKNRGARLEEQVQVLRALWTQELVTFNGRWHKITDAGVNPLPIQKPIPIWFGGGAEQVLRRIGRLGDGWFPQLQPDEKYRATFEKISCYAREAERDPSKIGVEGRITMRNRPIEACAQEARQWKALGASHVSINTMSGGLATAAAHIEMIRKFKAAAAGL